MDIKFSPKNNNKNWFYPELELTLFSEVPVIMPLKTECRRVMGRIQPFLVEVVLLTCRP
jgi:hypothetical protein